MAKSKIVYVCDNCGHEMPKWQGQCPMCKEWNTFAEMKTSSKSSSKKTTTKNQNKPQILKEVKFDAELKIKTDIAELDRVLGGGVVVGSLVLVGGDPGIGKSTLMLQICQSLGSKSKKVLYITGEESLHQVKLRAERLNVTTENLCLLNERDMSVILDTVRTVKPDILMIDSIQTMYNDEVSSYAGSVSQVREVTSQLMNLAKEDNIATFIVGHVTKDGNIAGPRVLEHMVDTVLYFEGDKNAAYRILKSVKNRFGATNEMGIFSMEKQGLVEVKNPSEYMLQGRPINEAGSLVVCGIEGTRPLFVEIQALVSYTTFNNPRRTVTGADYNRVMMIIAVLEKKYGISLMDNDCYVNIAGGIRMSEPSLDLGIALAIISSTLNIPVDCKTAVMGELGLTGEIRGITYARVRVKEAKKLGFKRIFVPSANKESIKTIKGIEIIPINHISEMREYL